MIFKSINKIFASAFLVIFIAVALPAPVLAVKDPLIMGVFPRRGAKVTISSFKPIADYLSIKLGREVILETAPNFKLFWSGVKSKHYDIVHYNQYHYVRSHRDNGYEVILSNEEFGHSTISGVLVVTKDSGINSIADLKGKSIVFGGGKMAMMSYIVPRYLLLNAGLTADDYEISFAKNPPNAVFTVCFGQATASGAGNIVLQLPVVKSKCDVKKIKIIAESESLRHLPWAVSDKVLSEERKDIQRYMLELNNSEEGKKILTSAKLTGLHEANDEDYNQHREIIKKVLDEDY